MLAEDPALFHELMSAGTRGAERVAKLVPEILAARSPPGDRRRRIALALAQTMQVDVGRGEGAPLGPCVDSCEASRLAEGPVRPGQAAVDIGALLLSACGGDVTCCCTSGTCGGPTCGGSTCDVTCSGESCGSTCGDSCGMTSNLEFDAALERQLESADQGMRVLNARHVINDFNCKPDLSCYNTCVRSCRSTELDKLQEAMRATADTAEFVPQAWRWR
ncbi:MAG TPA: hypothetical protein VGW34_02160 [Allosphingosinicella sp.]|nr:hypothetical protein [Allosphingosinicella sp.]